ncbi:unnamed protein product [marine sediment metagenome]|uniref:Uncharacterized protein n=1 Tax=marine sediment metagenome TaxID=412755 RepID=X1QU04_9ZZZZ
MKLKIVLELSEEGGFAVYVPSLPIYTLKIDKDTKKPRLLRRPLPVIARSEAT